MSQHIKPYYPYFHGFTTPLIIKVLEKVGLPPEIEKLPPRQQGPMAVTLLGELAAVAVRLLVTSLSEGQMHAEIEHLREKKGGDEYRNLRRKLKSEKVQRTNLFDDLLKFERSIITHDLGSTICPFSRDWPFTKSPLAGFIYWNVYAPNPSLVDKFKSEYESLSIEYETLTSQFDLTNRQMGELISSINENPEFISLKDALLKKVSEEKFVNRKTSYAEKMICVDFCMSDSILDRGVCHYLRNTEGRWWQNFTAHVDRDVNSCMNAPQNVMLRDTALHVAIENKVSKKIKNKLITLNAATCEVLTAPHVYNSYLNWAPCKITQSNSGFWRSELRKQDEFAINWISSRAGNRHPMDTYRSWLFEIFKNRPNNLDLENPYLIDHVVYTLERAQNELYWCLLRRAGSRVSFDGFFQNDEDRIKWEQRVESWRNREPDFWEWPPQS